MVKETGCCPKFDPNPWDGKTVKFQSKRFIKDRVRSVFHIPLNFGKVMVRDMEKIWAAKATDPKNMMLSDENSLWGSDIYIGVSKEVPDAENVTISGTFMMKVFEGPYKDMGKWIKEMEGYVASKGKELKKLYFWYTTCPKCAKAYGKNYTVLVAEI